MLNQPGQDDHDGDLELHHPGLDDDIDDDDCPPLDDEREQVGYELFDWDVEELDELDEVLHELGLPHEWVSDGYEVVVHAEDEARVDGLLPRIRYPDEIPAEADPGDDTDARVLSDLFVSASRMQKDPTGDAVSAFLDAAEQVGAQPPYGVDERDWDLVLASVDDLIDLFHAAGPIEQISLHATALRDRLRPLV